jgi:osmotically-inducible protein OsmY
MTRILFALSVATAGLTLGATSPRAAGDDGSARAAVAEEQEIRARLDQAPDLRNNFLDVKVDDGIAVLSGVVDSEQEKKEAQRLAHVDGILGVNNHLQVGPRVKHPSKD